MKTHRSPWELMGIPKPRGLKHERMEQFPKENDFPLENDSYGKAINVSCLTGTVLFPRRSVPSSATNVIWTTDFMIKSLSCFPPGY